MNLWWWLIGASLLVYLTKLSGFLVPDSVLERPVVIRVAGCMTIGLLASLVMMNTVSAGQGIALDARLLALAAAAVALLLRAPFLVVVVAGALAAGLGRAVGLP